MPKVSVSKVIGDNERAIVIGERNADKLRDIRMIEICHNKAFA